LIDFGHLSCSCFDVLHIAIPANIVKRLNGLANCRAGKYDAAMKLGTWIEKKGRSQTSLANDLGVHLSTVHKYIHKHRIPDGRMIYEIQKLTKGQVRLEDWFN
jgi:hypothetical protein